MRLISLARSGSGGTRADQGVRLTIYAGFANLEKLFGIRRKRLAHFYQAARTCSTKETILLGGNGFAMNRQRGEYEHFSQPASNPDIKAVRVAG